MTLQEAIDVLGPIHRSLIQKNLPFASEALQLGIEALEEVEKARSGDPALDGELLPSETSE